MSPDISVGIDCFVDADFAGNWRRRMQRIEIVFFYQGQAL